MRLFAVIQTSKILIPAWQGSINKKSAGSELVARPTTGGSDIAHWSERATQKPTLV